MSSQEEDDHLAHRSEEEEEVLEGEENSRVEDSSEEDEEDDEEEMQKVRDGFIVDEENDEDEEDDTRHHKKKKRRRRHHEEEDNLDEDDLDLVMENAGLRSSSSSSSKKSKRLKRAIDDEDEDLQSELADLNDDDANQSFTNNKLSASSSNKKSALDDMFSDDEDDGLQEIDEDEEDDDLAQHQRSRRRQDDEMDDFIEEDYEENEEEDDDRTSRRFNNNKHGNKTRNISSVGGSTAVSTGKMGAALSDIDQEKLDAIFEIFGDGTDFEWALDLEGQDGELLDEDEDLYDEDGNNLSKTGAPKLSDIFEETELKERMLTEEDNEVRSRDVPERYQLIRSVITNNYTKKYELNAEDFAYEKTWISDIIIKERKQDFLTVKPHLYEPMQRAISDALTFISQDNLEVPFIWNHRRDFITSFTKNSNTGEPTIDPLLDEDDLWLIVQLDIEYHFSLKKKKTILRMLKRLGIYYDYSDEVESLKGTEQLKDFYEFILFKYSKEVREIETRDETKEKDDNEDDYDVNDFDEDAFNEDETQKNKDKSNGASAHKLKLKKHSKFVVWERIRASRIYEMIEKLGITATQVGENMITDTTARQHFTKDDEQDPDELVSNIAHEPRSKFPSEKLVMNTVIKMYAEELYHEPKIRQALRQYFEKYAKVGVKLTERGKVKILKSSPDYNFKYLTNKNFISFLDDPSLFLRMLQAEADHLIDIVITVDNGNNSIVDRFFQGSMASDSESELSIKWNKIRKSSFESAMKKTIANVTATLKEQLRKKCESILFFRVRKSVKRKIDRAPYQPYGYESGSIPDVLAISIGEGNFNRDAVVGVVIKGNGEVKKFLKFEHRPGSQDFKEEFSRTVSGLKVDVISINGYNVQTARLYKIVKDIISDEKILCIPGDSESPELELLFVPDDIARLYQNSERAKEEFPDKPSLIKYCIALARYTQSPLLEFANLKNDVTAIYFHKYQNLLSADRLKEAIDTVFVDIVNLVGVDINQAIRETYYANCLQYVAGLGPRKAAGLLKGIQAKSSSGLVNRSQLVTLGITGKTIFMNCASFLKIPESYSTSSRRRANLSGEEPDLLDETRIHPEDYVLAQKMATDALELDSEDVDEMEKNGESVIRLLREKNNIDKLEELSLEEYATELEVKRGKRKRATLHMILEELKSPYEEFRQKFARMDHQEIFVSLTGESAETFYAGVVVTIVLKKISSRGLIGVTQFLASVDVPLECAVEDTRSRVNLSTIYQPQQAIQAKIMSVDYQNFQCSASVLERDTSKPELHMSKNIQKLIDNNEWDIERQRRDERTEKMKLEAEEQQNKIVKHPLFHNFTAKEAEDYLGSYGRGACVIRPSSRGIKHLAVTWKVDNNLYQHIDVRERLKRNEITGEEITEYVIKRDVYSDLDEFITRHVRQLAKFVEQLVNNDRFTRKPRLEIESYMETYVSANKNRAYYTFAFDHKHPGWFHLFFKANVKLKVYVFPVEVTNHSYRLQGFDYTSVNLLINGFKQLMKNKALEKRRNQSNGGHNQQPSVMNYSTPQNAEYQY